MATAPLQSNIVLSYPNRIDECSVYDVYDSTNWLTKLPLSNIKNHVLKKVARTKTGVKSPFITAKAGQISVSIAIVLPKHREIGCVAIANHNLTTNAKVRVIGFYNANFTNTVNQGVNQFDSGADYFAYPRLFPQESGNYLFEDPNWWYGTIEAERLMSYTPLTTFYPTENKVCQSLIIHITDSNNSDNFIQMGRIFLGRTIEPEFNPEYGDIHQGYTDLTEMQRAVDNTKYFHIKPKMRTLSCVLKHLSVEEAFGGFLDAQREVGLSGELLYSFSKPSYIGNINMTVDKYFYMQNFLCNFADLNPVTRAYFNGCQTEFKLEEIV